MAISPPFKIKGLMTLAVEWNIEKDLIHNLKHG